MSNTEVFENSLETWLDMRKVYNAKKEKNNEENKNKMDI